MASNEMQALVSEYNLLTNGSRKGFKSLKEGAAMIAKARKVMGKMRVRVLCPDPEKHSFVRNQSVFFDTFDLAIEKLKLAANQDKIEKARFAIWKKGYAMINGHKFFKVA